jgi:hypothetical protein
MRPLHPHTKELIIAQRARGQGTGRIAKELGIGRNIVWEVLKEHAVAAVKQPSVAIREQTRGHWKRSHLDDFSIEEIYERTKNDPKLIPILAEWNQKRLAEFVKKKEQAQSAINGSGAETSPFVKSSS